MTSRQSLIIGYAALMSMILMACARHVVSSNVADIPLGGEVWVGSATIDCKTAANGTKWGLVAVPDSPFVFGSDGQHWRVRPEIGVSNKGQKIAFFHVLGAHGFVGNYTQEPTFTFRISNTYAFTPPIQQQSYVLIRRRYTFPLDLLKIDHNREEAERMGLAECFISECFLSAHETETLWDALRAATNSGGNITISGPATEGIVTIKYNLSTINNLPSHLRACL